MDALTDDLRALVLQKKDIAENMRLILYNQSGLMFYLTRNMSDPPWFVQVHFPTAETRVYIHKRTCEANTPFQPATFLPPLLVRTEQTLRHIVDTELKKASNIMYDTGITCIYTQGTTDPPHFADTGGCLTEPDDDAKQNELRDWVRRSYRNSLIYHYDEDDPEEVSNALQEQLTDIMAIVKALLAEF